MSTDKRTAYQRAQDTIKANTLAKRKQQAKDRLPSSRIQACINNFTRVEKQMISTRNKLRDLEKQAQVYLDSITKAGGNVSRIDEMRAAMQKVTDLNSGSLGRDKDGEGEG
jgi:hypothetical protein